MSPRRRNAGDERGVSLVLVLVTLVVFGLIVPVLGQFGSTNGVSGYILKGQRFDRYAAEAGMQGAIQWARVQRQAGRQGTKCPDISTANLNGAAGPNASRSVTVQCAGFDGNGLPAATPSLPAYALMALGGSNTAIQLSDGALRTSGPWWSGGGIAVNGTSVDAAADSIGARGGCTGVDATKVSPLDCNSSRTETDPGEGPGRPYSPAQPLPIRVDPIRQPCDGAGSGTVVIEPGLHWQRDYFNGLAQCSGVTKIVLASGNGPHVFDFSFYGDRRTDWTVDPGSNRRVTVVSGPVGADPSTCATTDSPVLFARDFDLVARRNATLDLCGDGGSGQRIAVAQVTHGDDPRPQTSGPALSTRIASDGNGDPFDFPSTTDNPPADLGALTNVDCVVRDGCPTGTFLSGTLKGSNGTGEVVLDLPDTVPAGAWLQNLTVELAHTETENHNGDLQRLRVWLTGLPPQYAPECDLSDPRHEVDGSNRWRNAAANQVSCDVSGAGVPYTPTGDLKLHVAVDTSRSHNEGNRTVDAEVVLGLDHVALRSTYVSAGFRTAVAGNGLISVEDGAALHAFGTVYVPTGLVSLNFGATAATRFERGLIVRTLVASNFPNDPTFTPFSLPGGGNYTDRLATFRAFLGSDTSDATKAVLTARVRFCDLHPEHGAPTPDCGATASAGGPAKILAWDPRR